MMLIIYKLSNILQALSFKLSSIHSIPDRIKYSDDKQLDEVDPVMLGQLIVATTKWGMHI